MADTPQANNQIEIPDSVGVDLPQSRLTVPDSVDAEEFFTQDDGTPTLVDHADLERTVPNEEKEFLTELERTWLNKPFSFGVIYENEREQELRYYVVEPVLSDTERALVEFFKEKLEFTLDMSQMPADAKEDVQGQVIREKTLELMGRYDLIRQDLGDDEFSDISGRIKRAIIRFLRKLAQKQASKDETVDPVPIDRDPDTGERQKLEDDQIEKIIYYLIRDFVRFGKIDPFKQDAKIEDISCNGYNQPVFVYHTDHEQMITNVGFGKEDLDDFVIELAQSAGKGISKRNPNVDATLDDGSRAQLTLGEEVSAYGTNFTIRQFKDIPFTPVDLVSWQTFSMEEVVYLWLAIENNKNMVVSGGTASGKTTTLNALSLFISSGSKIVSIEDTRELIIPQRNWVADITRESFRKDDESEIAMYELLEDALRKRPDYILVGEVRGEEGHTLFHAMNSGHTVFTTFHAKKPKEVLTRFIEEPIDVSRTMASAIDIVISQSSIKVGGRKVRRCTEILELLDYNSGNENYQFDETYFWESDTDTHISKVGGQSTLMEQIRQRRGWDDTEYEREVQRRKIVLSYLIHNGLNSYAAVASTLQGYMNSPRTIMELIANDELADRVENLKSMKSIKVEVDSELEEYVPRPSPGPELRSKVENILKEGADVLEDYGTTQSQHDGSQEIFRDPDDQQEDSEFSGSDLADDSLPFDDSPEQSETTALSENGRSSSNTDSLKREGTHEKTTVTSPDSLIEDDTEDHGDPSRASKSPVDSGSGASFSSSASQDQDEDSSQPEGVSSESELDQDSDSDDVSTDVESDRSQEQLEESTEDSDQQSPGEDGNEPEPSDWPESVGQSDTVVDQNDKKTQSTPPTSSESDEVNNQGTPNEDTSDIENENESDPSLAVREGFEPESAETTPTPDTEQNSGEETNDESSSTGNTDDQFERESVDKEVDDLDTTNQMNEKTEQDSVNEGDETDTTQSVGGVQEDGESESVDMAEKSSGPGPSEAVEDSDQSAPGDRAGDENESVHADEEDVEVEVEAIEQNAGNDECGSAEGKGDRDDSDTNSVRDDEIGSESDDTGDGSDVPASTDGTVGSNGTESVDVLEEDDGPESDETVEIVTRESTNGTDNEVKSESVVDRAGNSGSEPPDQTATTVPSETDNTSDDDFEQKSGDLATDQDEQKSADETAADIDSVSTESTENETESEPEEDTNGSVDSGGILSILGRIFRRNGTDETTDDDGAPAADSSDGVNHPDDQSQAGDRGTTTENPDQTDDEPNDGAMISSSQRTESNTAGEPTETSDVAEEFSDIEFSLDVDVGEQSDGDGSDGTDGR
jgi:flagellar protein FlaI